MTNHLPAGMLALLLLTGLGACVATPGPQARLEIARDLIASQHLNAEVIDAGRFRLLAAWTNVGPNPASTDLEPALIFLEGDGFAWASRRRISADPTPLDPLSLRLLARDPALRRGWLARPCQYQGRADPACNPLIWTDQRYGVEVVAALNRGVDRLKALLGADRLLLAGYSGGGTLALLLAARRVDVAGVITVAANPDLAAWAAFHGIAPLPGSLDPAHERERTSAIPQLHFAGGQDEISPSELIRRFAAAFPDPGPQRVVIAPAFDHQCCWEADWPRLRAENPLAP